MCLHQGATEPVPCACGTICHWNPISKVCTHTISNPDGTPSQPEIVDELLCNITPATRQHTACMCDNKWACRFKDTSGELWYGDCGCESMRHISYNGSIFSWEPGAPITDRCTPANGVTPESWELEIACVDHKYQNSAGCAGTKPFLLSTKCSCDLGGYRTMGWTCPVPGTRNEGDCEGMCSFYERSDDLCEIDPDPICVNFVDPIRGRSQTVSDASCKDREKPTIPDCAEERKKNCRFGWSAEVKIFETVHQIPFRTLEQSTEMCPRIRDMIPCTDSELVIRCYNYFNGKIVSDSLCNEPRPTITNTADLCPKSAFCTVSSDPQTYTWGCRGTGDGFSIERSLIQYWIEKDNKRFTKCACIENCKDYVIDAVCHDSDDKIVSNDLCDPAHHPLKLMEEVKCAALHPDDCRNITNDNNDSPSQPKCQQVCSITIDDKEYFVQCRDWKEYCFKFTAHLCTEDIILNHHCGVVSIDGIFIPSDDECCSELIPPWVDGEGLLKDNNDDSFNCNDLLSSSLPFLVPSPQPSPLLSPHSPFTQLVATNNIPSRSCEYAWLCRHPKTGDLMPCDCDELSLFTSPSDNLVRFICQDFPITPLCYKRSRGGTWISVEDDPDCNGVVKPVELECKENARCNMTYKWSCSNNYNTQNSSIPCECAEKSCKGYHIRAMCMVQRVAGEDFQELVSNEECLGVLGYPFASNLNTNQFCPGDTRLCDFRFKAEWACYLPDRPTMAVQCSCKGWDKEEIFGCNLKMERRCINPISLQTLPEEVCHSMMQYTPDDFCPCEDNDAHVLKCYRNGDMGQEVDCGDDCSVTNGDCEYYKIKAICFINKEAGVLQPVPLSSCKKQLDALANPVVLEQDEEETDAMVISTFQDPSHFPSLPSPSSITTTPISHNVISQSINTNNISLPSSSPRISPSSTTTMTPKPIHFDPNTGFRICHSPNYSTGCNARWMCRTWIDGKDFIFECDGSGQDHNDYCTQFPIIACKKFTVSNVCVETVNGQNVIISSSICLAQPHLTPKFGSAEGLYQCPTVFEPECLRKDYFGWLCTDNDGSPFQCNKNPSCQDRAHLHNPPFVRPCEDFIVVAKCYHVVMDGHDIVSHTEVDSSKCDWLKHPILDSSLHPSSIKCPCQRNKCPLGMGTWPHCQVKEIEGVIGLSGNQNDPSLGPENNAILSNNNALTVPITDNSLNPEEQNGLGENGSVLRTIEWNYNPLDGLNDLCKSTSVTLHVHSDEFHFGTMIRDNSATMHGGRFRLPAIGIDTSTLKNQEKDIPFQANTTLITPCGEYPGPIIDVTPWCVRNLCKKPFLCDNIAQSCRCAEGLFGPECEMTCKENQFWNTTTRDCQCKIGFKWDATNKECVEKCPHVDEVSIDCGVNGQWSSKSCQCECENGHFSHGPTITDTIQGFNYPSKPLYHDIPEVLTPCSCFERYFNITVSGYDEELWNNTNNDQKARFQALWLKLSLQYLKSDLIVEWTYDITYIGVYTHDDGFITIGYRFRSCSEKAADQFQYFYNIFLNYYSPNFTREDIIDNIRSRYLHRSLSSLHKQSSLIVTSDDIDENAGNIHLDDEQLLFGSFIKSDLTQYGTISHFSPLSCERPVGSNPTDDQNDTDDPIDENNAGNDIMISSIVSVVMMTMIMIAF